MTRTRTALQFVSATCLALLASCAPASEQASALVPSEHPHFTIRGRLAVPRIRYRLEPSQAAVSEARFVAAARVASAFWNATEIANIFPAGNEEADLVISFETDVHGVCTPFGRSTILAHTGPCGGENYIHIDADRDWSTDPARLERILAHEFGHALGLGHSLDPAALMNTEDDPQRFAPTASDLAGLQSIYGGGKDASGDFALLHGECDSSGTRHTVLRGAAPHGITQAAAFDTLGDGPKEVLIWRTDKAGHGDLTIYSFDEQLALIRSVGPLHGLCPPNSAIRFGVTPEGERLLIRIQPTGEVHALQFQTDGSIQPRPKANFTLPGLADADGDGRLDAPFDFDLTNERMRCCQFTADLNEDGQLESGIRLACDDQEGSR